MATALNYLIKTSSTAIVYAQITNSLFAQTGSYINFEKACYGEINKYQDITYNNQLNAWVLEKNGTYRIAMNYGFIVDQSVQASGSININISNKDGLFLYTLAKIPLDFSTFPIIRVGTEIRGDITVLDDIRQVSIAVVNNAGSTGILGMSNGSVFTIDKIN